MTYQGHLPDGSSVQRHSAGGLYPFVLFAKDGADGKLAHGYIDPRDGSQHLVGSYDETVAKVESLLAQRTLHAEVETGLLACDTPVPERQGNDWLRANAARQAAAVGLLDAPSHEAFTKAADDLARFR